LTQPINSLMIGQREQPNVQSFNFAPRDGNGFFLTGSIEIQTLIDETQPWLLQLGTTQGQFNTLKDTDILDCYLVAEYTLQWSTFFSAKSSSNLHRDKKNRPSRRAFFAAPDG
jgi:hypothetical protein